MMRTVKNVGDMRAVILEHVVKVAMHPIQLRMIIHPQIDAALIGDHHHRPSGCVRFGDRLRNIGEDLEIAQPNGVRATLPVDDAIPVQEKSFPHGQ